MKDKVFFGGKLIDLNDKLKSNTNIIYNYPFNKITYTLDKNRCKLNRNLFTTIFPDIYKEYTKKIYMETKLAKNLNFKLLQELIKVYNNWNKSDKGALYHVLEKNIENIKTGLSGEIAVIDKLYERYGNCLILHDITLQIENESVQIDLLLLINKTIILLEIKNIKGEIELSTEKKILVRNRETYYIRNPFLQIQRAKMYIDNFIGTSVTPIVVNSSNKSSFVIKSNTINEDKSYILDTFAPNLETLYLKIDSILKNTNKISNLNYDKVLELLSKDTPITYLIENCGINNLKEELIEFLTSNPKYINSFNLKNFSIDKNIINP